MDLAKFKIPSSAILYQIPPYWYSIRHNILKISPRWKQRQRWAPFSLFFFSIQSGGTISMACFHWPSWVYAGGPVSSYLYLFRVFITSQPNFHTSVDLTVQPGGLSTKSNPTTPSKWGKVAQDLRDNQSIAGLPFTRSSSLVFLFSGDTFCVLWFGSDSSCGIEYAAFSPNIWGSSLLCYWCLGLLTSKRCRRHQIMRPAQRTVRGSCRL